MYIQPIDENGGISETNQNVINDKKRILEVVNKVNTMKVIQSPSRDFNERIEEINQQQSYAVSLSDSSNKQFDMIFFKDGSIQFQLTDKKKQKMNLYLSKEKQPELLQEIKTISEQPN